jgi:hypothetical protein
MRADGATGDTGYFEASWSGGMSVNWSNAGNVSKTSWLNGNIQFTVGTVTNFIGLNTSGSNRLTLADTVNFEFNTGTGTKIGTATSQKLAFWNATPIVQPTTGIAEASFVANGGGVTVTDDSTFDGYTIQQVVKALRDTGLLA